MKKLIQLLFTIVFVAMPSAIMAQHMPTPHGEIILEVQGDIETSNQVEGTAFDIQMLQGLEVKTYETQTPWSDNSYRFRGATLASVLETVGAKDGAVITLYALLYKPIVFYSAYFSKRASDFDVYAFIGGEYEITKRMNEIDEKGNRKTDKESRLYTVLEIALEMVKRGFKFKTIDIQKSTARDFIIDEDNVSLVLPFITVDGLGLKAAENIVKKREESGFKSRDDIKAIPGLSTTIIKKLDMLDCFEDMPDNSQMNLFNFS